MKIWAALCVFLGATACADEIWEPSKLDAGEIARQFPKHRPISIHTYPTRGFFDSLSAGSKIRQIGIERTACYGKCPVYSLIVNGDGTFRYHGERFTKRLGDWRGTVDAVELAMVLRYAAEMNYFDLEDLYGVNESDLPGTFTLVKNRTQKKVIYDYGSVGPARLVAFEDMLDRLLEKAKWKRR